MDFGGRHAFALRRYVEGEIREAALGLRAPSGSSAADNLAWLDKLATERGVEGTPSQMLARARAGPARRRQDAVRDRRGRPRMETGDAAWTSLKSAARADAILAEVRKAVVGQDDAVELLLIALFSGGHVLLEGVPGTAQDAAGAELRRQPGAALRARPVHART